MRSGTQRTFEQEENEIERAKIRLDRFRQRVQGLKDKDDDYKTAVRESVIDVKAGLTRKWGSTGNTLDEILKAYKDERDFLSQQIDERSHQIFTLGALFAPVSFLIFAQTVVGRVPFPFDIPLMLASLLCYWTWLRMYNRTHKLNKYSYPRIHTIEKMLDFSGHLHLKELVSKHNIESPHPEVFTLALILLIGLWSGYIPLQLWFQ